MMASREKKCQIMKKEDKMFVYIHWQYIHIS
jgi:hypothetical protein